MSALDPHIRAAALRFLLASGNGDLVPVLGLDRPRRGRAAKHASVCGVCGRTGVSRVPCGTCYARQYRARLVASGALVHGTHSGYNAGCRCPTCTAHQRDYRRGLRSRQKAGS